MYVVSISYPQLNPARVKELCELLSYWNGASFICNSQVRLGQMVIICYTL